MKYLIFVIAQHSFIVHRISQGHCKTIWHSTDKYRRVIWQCNAKFKGDRKCTTLHLTEDVIKERFLQAVSKLTEDRDALLEDCRVMADALSDTTAIDRELEELSDELDTVTMLTEKLIAENATTATSQDEYNEKYDGYSERYSKAQSRIAYLNGRKTTLAFEVDMIECFATEIRLLPDLPVEFNDRLWNRLIEKVTVNADDTLGFKFKNGSEVTLCI